VVVAYPRVRPLVESPPARVRRRWEAIEVARICAISDRQLRAKRILDLVVCVLIAPLALAIGFLCAVAILIDSPGPILYAQERTGRNGSRFRMWKFRTMVVNAEELKESLRHLSIVPAPDFKVPNDPRVTRVGRFLRKTSLDEFPQLLNVLRGEMSLVGPRPTSFSATTYEVWQTERLDVPPGITGLWQVSARTGTDFKHRLRLDLYYVHNYSLLLDLAILARTIVAVARQTGH
jgi:lipopolysaccharide/colanic/teichoic acid biosynthesis glycosyltransferase